ncbi:MAG: chloramphenicol acetyltransferase [Bacteroidales bacterium]|nr:chloramphenicol acetyltransferase [Bacteroidales bacterium]
MNSNTRTIINLNTWERAKSYEFYKNFINPQVCITAEVECTAAYEDCKENKRSFFRKYVYAILRSVNDIKELKYRIEVKDGEEQVVLYDKISLLTPVKINSSGEFTTIKVPYHLTFEKFNAVMDEIMDGVDKEVSEPYYQEEESDKRGFCDVVLVSALPDLHFTSISPTQSCSHGSRKPIINVGKAVMKEGKMMMPIAIAFHHGLCDGFHISSFYSKVEEYLKNL